MIQRNPAPKIILGLTNNLTYQNFDLVFTLRSNIGHYIYNNVASSTGFFDRLSETPDFTKEQRFDFVKGVGESFVPMYTRLAESNRHKEFSPENKIWQRVRRGRYVEFNLVYDKGTKFGLDTDGRIESILMSLPPQANWVYDFQTKEGSPEAETLKCLKKEQDWLNIL